MSELTAEQELAALATELSTNPATRKQFLGLVKQARPAIAIPEIEQENLIEQMRSEFQSESQALRQELNDFKLNGALSSRREDVRKQFPGVDLNKVEDALREGKFSDHLTAAKYFHMESQSATPTPHRFERVKPLSTDHMQIDLEAYRRDPEAAMLNDIYKDLDDVMSGNVRLN